MSSEGSLATSSSSKIRQFGLYRTIDARTEEFLKLSKKRQLRQGCACAVVSTLITVTVVVSVLLVYEYGINSSWSPGHIKGWFGLMNGTESMTFEEKFAKSHMNFDRTTIKLLPIIIKALKQNRYLEKVMYDYTSSSPEDEGKSATEFTFKRNIFTDLKIIKPPSSRLYAIAYKSAPITFNRTVTRNQDYYTKLRKLRDYKRITNYVDKMISAKVGPGYTRPLKNEDYYQPTETNTMKLRKPSIKSNANRTYQSKKYKINLPIQLLNVNPLKKKSLQDNIKSNFSRDNLSKSKTAEHTNSTICTCSSKLGNLLNKLQASIQQLLLADKSNKLLQPCSQPDHEQEKLPDNRPVFIITTPTSEIPFTSKINRNKIFQKPYVPFNNYISKPIASKPFNELDNVSVDHSKEETDMNIKKYILDLSNLSRLNINSENSTDHLIITSKSQALNNLPMMQPPSREDKIYSSTTHRPNNATTIENYIQLTELKGRPKKTILRNYIIFPVIESELKNSKYTNWPLFTPNFHYKDTIKGKIHSKPRITTATENDYNEEKITMKYLKDDIKKLDVEHSSESPLQVNIEIENTIDDERFNDSILFGKQNMSPTTEEVINTTITLEENTQNEILRMKALEKNSSLSTNTYQTFETNDIASVKPENTTSNPYNPLRDEVGMLEDDSYKVTPEEDFYDDTSPMPSSNVTKITQSFTFEKNRGIQSMLPQNRPTYLKIQRSDWKHIESDYDRMK